MRNHNKFLFPKLAISGIDTLSLDPSIKLILMRAYKTNLYVDTFVTIAFYCTYMCMNFVHSCVWQLFLNNKRREDEMR